MVRGGLLAAELEDWVAKAQRVHLAATDEAHGVPVFREALDVAHGQDEALYVCVRWLEDERAADH